MSDTKPSTPEYRAISSLHNWENNPRTATKDGIERLIKQIKKLGVYKPLIITEDGTVLGGNMRLKALGQMGEKKVWVSVVQADTEEKKIEYALSDNDRVGKYEGDQLANLIGNFPEVEWGDYSVDIKEPELVSDLMDSFKEVEEDEAPAVEMGPAESKLGEIYQLGRHRVMCGDSTDKASVELLMDGAKADMVFTDPPYNTQMQQGRTSKEWGIIENDNMTNVDFGVFCKKFVDILYLYSEPNTDKYICMGWSAYNLLYEAMPNVKNCIVWVKNNFGLGHGYRPQHEFIVYDGGTLEANNESNVWNESKDASTAYKHPTQKPTAIPARAIKNSSKKEDIILDIFLGSGSTLIACEQTDRTCYGMELDPHYVDVIRKRYNNFVHKTGLKQEKNAKQ